MAVLAQSGAGKSYAVKLLVLRGLLQGVTHYVIDPEGEYTLLAEVAGGRVIRPGAPGQGLNPFALGATDEVAVAYKVGALRRLLEVMVGERLSPRERAELDSALAGYYQANGHQASFEGFYSSLKGQGSFALTLRPFYEGSLRFLLGDGQPLEEGEAPITVFDLSHLDPDLRPAVAHLCAEAAWSLSSQDPRPRVLAVDEAWALLQHPEGAAFLSGVAKRARKHRLGVVTITQDVQDFLEGQSDRAIAGHSGRTLVQNSAFKLLLRQDASAIPLVEQAFNLTRGEREWLLTCGRGEGLLITPAGRALLRIESTPQEHKLLTQISRPTVTSK
jgi:type IV secretory pathway VirB4 component